MRTLRDFPLEVLGAVYSTEAGAVLEDLRLRERAGQQDWAARVADARV